MLKTIPALAATAAIVITLSFAHSALAQCDSCGTGGTGGNVSFGYPGTGCTTCTSGVGGGHRLGNGQHGEVLKAKFAYAQAYNDKVAARNAAWPKPFTCGDRQLFFSYWTPMVAAGYADQNTVTGVHFKDDNTLTHYGKQQIAGIMRNMPTEYKVVYIQQDGDEETTQARYNTVQSLVQNWYGQAGQVRLTNRNPINQNGKRAEVTSNQYYEALSPPIIPVAAGTQSINSSVSN